MFPRAAVLVLALLIAPAAPAHPEIDDALARLSAQLATQPDAAALYLERGELYARHADWPSAEANYLRAAELSPRLPRLDLVPRTLARLARRPAALADYAAAFRRLAAPSPDLWLERVPLFDAPADALRSLDEAIAQIGPVLSLHLRALDLETALGRTDAALARLDLLVAGSERRELWLKRRGDLLAAAHRPTEARAAYTAALAAIAALPSWLARSPEIAALSGELNRLATTPP